MDRTNQDEVDNRTHQYNEANDRHTFMTDLDMLVDKLEAQGYTSQFRVEKDRLVDTGSKKKYKAKEVQALNFYRFEGISDAEDNSILYVIETSDGSKGTLIDAYGMYSDDDAAAFLNKIEVNKKVNGED